MSQLVPSDRFSFLCGPPIYQAMAQSKELSSETLQAFLAHAAFLCKAFGSDAFQVRIVI